MDKLVVGVVAALVILVLFSSGYLWYLTSGAEECERTSTDPRQ